MKKALIKYHHGLGDILQLTPHLRKLYHMGYVTDIMGMAQNNTSHLLDACPYTDSYIDIPNTWKSPLGFNKQLEVDMQLFNKIKPEYDWAGYANHLNIGGINKIDFTSKELGLDITDKTLEVFIPKSVEKEVLEYIQKTYPNGYTFVHTLIEEHTYHDWNPTDWINVNLPKLPIVDTGYSGNYYRWKDDINATFVLLREATHKVLSSSVMVHACDAMGVPMDIVNYGRVDRKVWPFNHKQLLKSIRENGVMIK